MKALRLIKKQDYQVVDVPEPVQDGDHVIIDVEMVGICGSDLSIWKLGDESTFKAGKIMGHEFVGIVKDPGPRSDLKVGDSVVCYPTNSCGECFYCKNGLSNCCDMTTQKGGPGVSIDGACSPQFAIVASKAFKIDPKVDRKAAALCEPLANAHRAAVTRGQIKKGDKVLITGGGIISILCAWWAKKQGAEYVAISEINPARIKHLRDTNAADEVVNFSEEGEFDRVKEKVGLGFDVAIEATHAHPDVVNKILLGLIRKGAKIIQIGATEGILGINFFGFQYKEVSYDFCWSMSEDDFKASIKAVEENEKDFLPHITKVIPMEEAQAMMEELSSGKTDNLKVMINPQL